MGSLTFSGRVKKVGINPYVAVPDRVLKALLRQAGKERGPIPVRGSLNGKAFTQTVVKYQGLWRLYLNGYMRDAAGIDVGDQARVGIMFDPKPRTDRMHPKLAARLRENQKAASAFKKLTPSRQKEILRYLRAMKTEESVDRNVGKVIQYLMGKQPKGLNTVLRPRK